MTRRYAAGWAALLTALLVITAGCQDQCLDADSIEVALPPATGEYRLVMTNLSNQLVELFVDGRSQGVFCADVTQADVGNFPQNGCSRIKVRLLDLDRVKHLDDCSLIGEPYCLDNNLDGAVCYDTTGDVYRVFAEIR